MRLYRGFWASVVVVALGVAALIGGASTGYASDEVCNENGREICITIHDTDDVSRSTDADRFMHNTVAVRNGGGSKLPHVSVTITMLDVDALGGQSASDADLVEGESTDLCDQPSGSNVLTCEAGDLDAGEVLTYAPLVFRTTTSATAVRTRMVVHVDSVERTREQDAPRDPVDEDFEAFEDTEHELDDDAERSWVFPGADVTLDTTETGQFTAFHVRGIPASAGSFVAELEEFAASDGTCTVCFGQGWSTHAPGVFSASNAIEVQTVIPLSQVPSGQSERGTGVRHVLDNGDVELITRNCGGAIDSGTPDTTVSCRRVDINRRLGTLTVEVFGRLGNGEWGLF